MDASLLAGVRAARSTKGLSEISFSTRRLSDIIFLVLSLLGDHCGADLFEVRDFRFPDLQERVDQARRGIKAGQRQWETPGRLLQNRAYAFTALSMLALCGAQCRCSGASRDSSVRQTGQSQSSSLLGAN